MENRDPYLLFPLNFHQFSLKYRENARNQSSIKTRLKFSCPIAGCSKIFQYKSESEKHMTRHCQERPNACQFPSGNKSFKRQDELRVHVQFHNEYFQFKCPFPECRAQFKIKPDLKKHVWQHFSAHQQLMRRFQETQLALFANIPTELWLQTLSLQAENNLLQNTKRLLNLLISSQKNS